MIKLENLTKIFETADGPATAADHVNLEVPEGDICILLGPSGCGKTTTLKMINRLIPPTSGKIIIGGKDTAGINVVELRRTIGYVIQQIGLFPNMTIVDNICVVPDLLGWDQAKSRKRAHELMEMVNLDPGIFSRRYPNELSGGQQQRVGVVRGLAADPPVMLMDEPFGAIDPINRAVIQDLFLDLQKTLRKTIMFVSHDIDEAVKMGDRIAIFRSGKLEQFDTPDNVLAHPANSFIADFVGSDRTLKRLRLINVKDAFVPETQTVQPGDALEKAARIMHETDTDYLIVVDGQQRPAGFISREMADAGKGQVAGHVSPLPGVINVSQNLHDAVSLMLTYAVDWLACVDDQGNLCGSITQRGVTHLLGRTYAGAQAVAGTLGCVAEGA